MPSYRSTTDNLSQGTTGPRSLGDVDCPQLAQGSVVPGFVIFTGSEYGTVDNSVRQSEFATSTGSLAHLRSSLHTQGLSAEAVTTIIAKGEVPHSKYSECWDFFAHWCSQRDADPFFSQPSRSGIYLQHLWSSRVTTNSVKVL